MIVATLLVDEDDIYVYNDGKLPARPKWDKELLSTFAEGNLVSEAGWQMLPKSIQMKTNVTHGEPTFPVTIPEIDGLADIIIVTRTYSKRQSGKKFRFTKFRRIVKQWGIEIWKRK